MIVTEKDLGNEISAHFIKVKPNKHECFYCGEPVETPYIIWQGATFDGTQIGLHPPCAARFASHLTRDFQRSSDSSPA